MSERNTYKAKWEIVRELGSGGQGVVHQVRKSKGRRGEAQLQQALYDLAKSKEISEEHRADRIRMLVENLTQMLNADDPSRQGALKILHVGDLGRDSKLAEARIENEILALHELDHPNIAKIIDSDPGDHWFVSEYYSEGSLLDHASRYVGKVHESLLAFRQIVEATAFAHENRVIHRDIKPNNIFVGQNGAFYLGDFGLVYFQDEQRQRLSETFENVGSHDWQPPWAYGRRVDDLKPSFDVFSLAKVFWSMISGIPILQLWYFDHVEFNVELLHPDSEFISLVNPLLEKCIVQFEPQCLADARSLLTEVDALIHSIETRSMPSNLTKSRPCIVCGIGKYQRQISWETDPTKYSQFGLRPSIDRRFYIQVCDNCENVELFTGIDIPQGWPKKMP